MINVLARHPDAEFVAICYKYAPYKEQCEKVAESSFPTNEIPDSVYDKVKNKWDSKSKKS